jgi:DNA-binding LacI/PurR family transcriptional regulator
LESEQITIGESFFASGDWSLESGYAAMQFLLSQTLHPSAVFVANDQMAVGAIYAIQDRGLKVPDDIAVVGYDNLELPDIFALPSQPLVNLSSSLGRPLPKY